MDLTGAGALAAAVAACAAASGAALVVVVGPVDSPNARSSHDRPTVTSGGLAVIAGAALGLAAFAAAAGPHAGLAPAVLTMAFAAVLGGVGALDDLYDIGAKAKLGMQALAALGFAIWVARIEYLPLPGLTLGLGTVLGVGGTALWLVTVTNAVNFMDGADGLAAGCMAIGLAVFSMGCFLAGEPGLGVAALAGAAALIGFLPWNLPSKRLFQGDAGSLFAGFLFAGLAVAAAARGSVSLYLAPFALIPFLTDVLLTLATRAKRGRSLLQAHRDHLYQLWLTRTGGSHTALACRAWGITAVFAGAGLASERAPGALQPWLFALAVLIAALGWKLVRRRLER